MGDSIRLQVSRVTQDAHEDEFGCDMLIDSNSNHQAWECDTVRDLLEEWSGTSKGRSGQPLTTPTVNDQREGQIHCPNKDTCKDGGFAIVSGLSHLRDDRQIHLGSAPTDEYIRACRHPSDEPRVRNRRPSEVEVASLRCGCRSALLRHRNNEDEDSYEESREPQPSEPTQAGEGADGRETSDQHGGHKAEDHRASAMVRERIESRRARHNTGGRDKYLSDEDLEADQLFAEPAPDQTAHVRKSYVSC